MIRLDYRDARPIYEQVKDGLRKLMVSGVIQEGEKVTGVLAPGEKLPSVRSLAMDLAINPNTIQRAYAQLEMEGYVYSVAGRGTFVAEGQEQNLVRRREVEDKVRPLLQELRELAMSTVDGMAARRRKDDNEVCRAVRSAVSSYLYKHTKRSPMILPILMEV